MSNKIHLADESRIFRTQLATLLSREMPLLEAVAKIEEKAPEQLAGLVRMARSRGPDPSHLLGGLAEVGLLHADAAVAAGWATAPGVDAEKFLRRQIFGEAEIARLQADVSRQLYRFFGLLSFVGVFALALYVLFFSLVFPTFFLEGERPPLPASGVARGVFTLSVLLLGCFAGLLASLVLALRLDAGSQWRRFRFLWSIPGARRLLAQRATWRVLSQSLDLMAAGLPAGEAVDASLKGFGLAAVREGGEILLPQSPAFDAAAVRAVNLGSRLGTFREQAASAVEHLKTELPFTAKNVARSAFYLAYVFLGLLVASMLVQMYEPIFKLAGVV